MDQETHYEYQQRATSRRPSHSTYDEYANNSPPHKVSRHRATTEDHAYYQDNWDHEEAHDDGLAYGEYHQHDRRNKRGDIEDGSENSSVQYQRARKSVMMW